MLLILLTFDPLSGSPVPKTSPRLVALFIEVLWVALAVKLHLGDEEPFWLQVTFISRHREDNIVVVVGPRVKELYGPQPSSQKQHSFRVPFCCIWGFRNATELGWKLVYFDTKNGMQWVECLYCQGDEIKHRLGVKRRMYARPSKKRSKSLLRCSFIHCLTRISHIQMSF